ncbi:hypothetical protein D3C71_1812310 [compost metagenome]
MHRVQSGAAIRQRGIEACMAHADARFGVLAALVAAQQILAAQPDRFMREQHGQGIAAAITGVRVPAPVETGGV